jgi:(2R)-sulfolactate sulfo-lyase subunit alpha
MKALLLHREDNVLVVIHPIEIGDRIVIDDVPCIARTAIGVGHKIARHPLAPGDKIIKYGAPIGSMTLPAEPGDHVHLHNMKSDYIATHLRDTLEKGSS